MNYQILWLCCVLIVSCQPLGNFPYFVEPDVIMTPEKTMATLSSNTPTPPNQVSITATSTSSMFAALLTPTITVKAIISPVMTITVPIDVWTTTSWIAVAAHNDIDTGSSDIYLVNEDGTDIRLLVSLPGSQMSPSWSQDGMKLLFSSVSASVFNIYLLDLLTGQITQLTDEALRWSMSPAWGRDDQTVLFTSSGTTTPNDRKMILLDLKSLQYYQLTDGTLLGGGHRWSPVADEVLFTSFPEQKGEIYHLDMMTGIITNLTQNPADDYLPTWSSDGEQIAFLPKRTDQAQLYLMKRDGSEVTRLTDTPNLIGGSLTWSPDGSKIAFLKIENNRSALYTFNVNTSKTQFVLSRYKLQSPAWRPIPSVSE